MRLFLLCLLVVISACQVSIAAPLQDRTISINVRAVDLHGNPLPNAVFMVWCGQSSQDEYSKSAADASGVAHFTVTVPSTADTFALHMSIIGLSDQQVKDMRGAPLAIRTKLLENIDSYAVDFVAPSQVVKLVGQIACDPATEAIQQSPSRFGDFPPFVGSPNAASELEGNFELSGFVLDQTGSGYLCIILRNDYCQIVKITPTPNATEYDCGQLACLSSDTTLHEITLDFATTLQGLPAREFDSQLFLLSSDGTFAVPFPLVESDVPSQKVPEGTYYAIPCTLDQLGKASEVVKSAVLKPQLDATSCPKVIVSENTGGTGGAAVQGSAAVTFSVSVQEAKTAWSSFIDPL